MDPPPPLPSSTSTPAVAHFNYPDSLDSSPRPRATASWDDHHLIPPNSAPAGKLRLMCSYGGHIIPRPHDKSLCYVGGDTRIIVADRRTSLSDLTDRLSKTFLNGQSFSLKYQLPSEDLDSLISVSSDEDLEIMIEEYDRLVASKSSSRLRVFLFPSKSESVAAAVSSIGSLIENSTKSEDWFLNALNGATTGLTNPSSVNSLLGLDDEVAIAGNGGSEAKESKPQLDSFGNLKGIGSNSNKQSAQDVHSVPDSPMMDTRSSFESTSSSPSMANLAPIRVHVEDQKPVMVGGELDEQLSRMSVSQKQQDDMGFGVSSSPATFPTSVAPPTTAVSGEYSNWIYSDDERSLLGYRNLPQTQQQPQPLQPQSQLKPTGGIDLASPDSVSSDGSITNPLSHRQRGMTYQDPTLQNPSMNNRLPLNPIDPNPRVQFQPQFEQQQQQQQFIQGSGGHYIHHHHPTGAMPMASYYPVYPPQQQHLHHPHHVLDQQYQVYYVPARPNQAYGIPMQQSNYNEPNAPSTQPQTPPSQQPAVSAPAIYNPTSRNVAPGPKSEMASSGVYRTATSAGSQFIQVPSNQHQNQPQYINFSQIHHPSQSVAPTTVVSSTNYGYELSDPSQAQMYYAQQLPPQMAAAQYQTMTSATSVGLPEASAQLGTDNMKQQQNRTSQPS